MKPETFQPEANQPEVGSVIKRCRSKLDEKRHLFSGNESSPWRKGTCKVFFFLFSFNHLFLFIVLLHQN